MKKFAKMMYTISVRLLAAGESCENYLEGCTYAYSENKPFLLKGTVDEMWPIDPVKLCKTYELLDGSAINPAEITGEWLTIRVKEDACPIWAEQVPVGKQVQVATSWGDVLTANRDGVPHGEGDFIVAADDNGKPSETDRWIVNGAVFSNTYREV